LAMVFFFLLLNQVKTNTIALFYIHNRIIVKAFLNRQKWLSSIWHIPNLIFIIVLCRIKKKKIKRTI
jgi:hypothetical protein